MDEEIPEAVEMPITGELDLHSFRPSDLGELLPAYFEQCKAHGILQVRVIHGKGSGALREGVHRLLPQLELVQSWTWPAAASYGGWGATWVHLTGNTESATKPESGERAALEIGK
jgi:DNA-nicking Smr family endonuclease